MSFFTFRQNNSGGFFQGPALYLIIEAVDAEAANHRARSFDVYFNGVDDGPDCVCCGDRWHEASDYDAKSEPLIYGERPEEFIRGAYFISFGDSAPAVLIAYRDGSVKTLRSPEASYEDA